MPAHIISKQYSGVPVHEIHIRGVPVMRRIEDLWVNATQILRAAGLPKPQRTKILERDVTGGQHEKVQGGYAGFQGTWIPLDSARELAKAFGIEEDLDPLFVFIPGVNDVPVLKKRAARKDPAPKKEVVYSEKVGKDKVVSGKLRSVESLSDSAEEGHVYTETPTRFAETRQIQRDQMFDDRAMVEAPEKWRSDSSDAEDHHRQGHDAEHEEQGI